LQLISGSIRSDPEANQKAPPNWPFGLAIPDREYRKRPPAAELSTALGPAPQRCKYGALAKIHKSCRTFAIGQRPSIVTIMELDAMNRRQIA
jgi:hypothetical protein